MTMQIYSMSFVTPTEGLSAKLSTAKQVTDTLSEIEHFTACSGSNWIGEVIYEFSKKINLTNLQFLNIKNLNEADYRFDVIEEEDEDEEPYSRYLIFTLDGEKTIKAYKELQFLFNYFSSCALTSEIELFYFDMNDAQKAIQEVNAIEYDIAKQNGLTRCLSAESEYANPYYFLGFMTVIGRLLEEAINKKYTFIHIIEDML